MNNKDTIISDLICLNCGNIFKIPRKKSQLRPIGHIKDIHCVFCGENKYYELGEDGLRHIIEIEKKDNKNNEEEKILKLYKGRNK